jgi:serine/threonine protein kinase
MRSYEVCLFVYLFICFQFGLQSISHLAIVALSESDIFHRDISTGNLMLRRLSDGKIQGVLGDFDLAVDVRDPSMAGNPHLHRTGTLPFLAGSLLKQLATPERKFPYVLRFDLESCIYVFLWDGMLHPEGRETPKALVGHANELLDSWLSSDAVALYNAKVTLSATCACEEGKSRFRISSNVECPSKNS